MEFCEHVKAVLAAQRAGDVRIYAEDTLAEDGWVNVRCDICHRIWETTATKTLADKP